jgi:hypothetical protein
MVKLLQKAENSASIAAKWDLTSSTGPTAVQSALDKWVPVPYIRYFILILQRFFSLLQNGEPKAACTGTSKT